MSFQLEQVVIPVGVLGTEADPGPTVDAWIDYFYGRLVTMRAAMPCQCRVRLGADVADRMYGAALPFVEETETLALLTQCGQDRLSLRVYLDRELAANSVRLE